MTLNSSIYYLKQVPEKPQLVGNLTKWKQKAWNMLEGMDLK
jgi:hypothetical protein